MSGCASYSRSPLDLAAHAQAWHGRGLEGASFSDRRGWLEEEAPAVFDATDGLALQEAQLVALAYHPDLRLARLELGRAAASSEFAGTWVDPQLELSALRITESVPDRWVLEAGLAFAIPLGGRLEAERDLADARMRAARQALREREWAVWCDVRRGWTAWSTARLRTEETEALLETLGALVESSARLAQAGELPSTEAALFAIEEARLRSRLGRLEAEIVVAEQELRALLGLAPAAPVVFQPSLGLAAIPPEAAQLGDAIARRNPQLAHLREAYEVAEEDLRHEIARQIPDLSLGPLFESDAGQSRIGLVGGIPVPLFSANRRAITEAGVERELARARFEGEYEALVARATSARLRAAALGEERAAVERSLLPLVKRQLEDALRLMQLGEGSSLVLLESLSQAHEVRLEWIETRSAEAQARAELERWIGPPDIEEAQNEEATP